MHDGARGSHPRPRVREKLSRLGPRGLDDAELLAILLGSGVRRRGVVVLARGLLAAHGGLPGLAARSEESGALTREHGIGPVIAGRLRAAFEIGRRLSPAPVERPILATTEEIAREVRDLCAARREHLVGLYLDPQSRLIARETIAVGTTNVARATARDLLEPALRLLAAAFAMAHNHPSGLADPSDDDIRFTRMIGRAAFLMGIGLKDHVIVAQSGHVSLKERGIGWEGLETAPP
ncbi:MAG: DNA repair protein RadC [Acidobacteria bacterium]|nr:DNA repair protein RadC [Acidobacteriota bacterium]